MAIVAFTGVLFLGIIIGAEYIGLERTLEKEIVEMPEKEEYRPVLDHEKAVIDVVEDASPAVVNIVATKYVQMPRSPFEELFGFPQEQREIEEERRETGEGTGFIISSDGIILTNRHVVADEEADYTVFLPDGSSYEVEVLAKDPTQDLAIVKIEAEDLPTVKIGDSGTIRIGQTAVAIGNALGELENTVSVGVISGSGRRVVARGTGRAEVLDDVIQTDAAINLGNSGGPLLNLAGEVVAINTATAMHAEGIGFAIPINRTKRAVESFLEEGRIIYPFLGVRYLMVNEEIKEEKSLPVDYGAVIISGTERQPAITPSSGAERAGLQEGDVILKMEGERIDEDNPLGRVIVEYYPGDEVTMTILRNNQEKEVKAVLGEME